MKHTTTILSLLLSGCFTAVPVIESDSADSSSSDDDATFGSGDDSNDDSISGPSDDDDDDDESSGESGGSSDNGEDETDDGASSDESGEPQTNYALDFSDGYGYAVTTETVEVVDFDGAAFTVEMWLQRTDTMGGLLFDTTPVEAAEGNGISIVDDATSQYTGFASGTCYINFGTNGNQRMCGPSLNELADGWHHVAIVGDGAGYMMMWIDGAMVADLLVEGDITNPVAAIAIGKRPTAAFVDLRGVLVDDVRISLVARYEEAFEPEAELSNDEDTMLLWTMQNEEGPSNVDANVGMEFDLADVEWAER